MKEACLASPHRPGLPYILMVPLQLYTLLCHLKEKAGAVFHSTWTDVLPSSSSLRSPKSPTCPGQAGQCGREGSCKEPKLSCAMWVQGLALPDL